MKSRNSAVDVTRMFESNVLRLIKSAPESRAIRAGEVDAILDPASGRVILMPAAQAALIERKTRFRSLVDLASDGYWEQDADYRFVLRTGAVIGNEHAGDGGILGKTLWELKFDNGSEIDWQTHRTQLEWRAIFRDLEFSCLDSTGRLRRISVSGEPMFDPEARFTGYRGITRDITGNGRATTAVPGSDAFARATLDALSAQVCVLDTQGTIVSANAAWRKFAATCGGPPIAEHDNYLAACTGSIGNEREDAAAMAAGIRQVIAGEREVFCYERSCITPPPARWFMATVTHLRGAGVARAIVAYEDITAIKHAERSQKLECIVARCLAVADDTAAAVQAVIRAVCVAQGLDCGRHFRLDSAAGVLVGDESWGVSETIVEQFMEKSQGATCRADAGLAGRVCATGEPLWIPSAAQNTRAPPTALAHETGLAGAVVIPVTVAGESIGALAFSGRSVHEPDESLLQAVRSIGKQLGEFLRRRQAEDELRRSAERFRRLTVLSADWHWQQDKNFRFTEIVGCGMAGTGDMRGKALWELPGIVLDDEHWAAHKAEISAHWSFCDFECAVALPDGQFGYYCISGEPLHDADGAFSGFHGTALDITERKRAEIALRQAAATRS